MALDKLVDSTKLDACLDAEADAIRAKTGDSNDITFDFANNKGFADAIAGIPSGGGGEKVYTKLGEVTVTEPVNSVNITFTEQMQNCECLYMVCDSIVLSEADWVYPRINTLPVFGYTAKVSNLSVTILFAPFKKPTGFTKKNIIYGLPSGFYPTLGVTVDIPKTIGLIAYTKNVNFISGKIEVWGYV